MTNKKTVEKKSTVANAFDAGLNWVDARFPLTSNI
jgi:hypothetical protein